MKKQTIVFMMLFVASFLFQSCSTDDVAASGSREVKYEVTGNFAGKITAAATTNNGISEIIEINKLPWTLELTAKDSIKSLFVTATGTGGMAGQTVTLKIYVGGKVVSTSTATALSGGIITVNSDLYNL
jgi:hypothetical protein